MINECLRDVKLGEISQHVVFNILQLFFAAGKLNSLFTLIIVREGLSMFDFFSKKIRAGSARVACVINRCY